MSQSSRHTKAGVNKMCSVDAHPHPCPLPQERENGSPLSAATIVLGSPTRTEAHLRKTATANKTYETPEERELFPLSPGERAGVRADVTTVFVSRHGSFAKIANRKSQIANRKSQIVNRKS